MLKKVSNVFFLVGIALLLNLGCAAKAMAQCADMDLDEYGRPADGCLHAAEDCNDHGQQAWPGNPQESCDGFDNDCDGMLDEEPPCSGQLDAQAKGGEVLVTQAGYNVHYPAAAWNGSSYGVVWEASSGSGGHFAVFDTEGKKLTPEIKLFQELFTTNNFDIVWTGKQYGLVWLDNRADDGPLTEVYFTMLDTQGQRLISDVKISPSDHGVMHPRLVWNGKEFGLFWLEDRAVDTKYRTYFRPIAADGTPGTEVFLDIGNQNPEVTTRSLAAVWNGQHYGLLLQKRDFTTGMTNYLALLNPDGSQKNLTTIAQDVSSREELDLTWNGTAQHFGCWWEWNSQIWLTLLNADGSFVTDPPDQHRQLTSGLFDNYLNYAAWNGDEYGLLYRPQIFFPSTDLQVRFRRVSASGEFLDDEIRITTGAVNYQRVVDFAWNGKDFGIFWWGPNISGAERQIRYNNVGNDFDADGRAGSRDCDEGNSHVWALPGEATNVTFAADKQIVSWTAPAEQGTDLGLTYDVLRSENAADFSSAVCIASGISGTTATDAAEPVPGAAYHYLVRAVNACGQGPLGDGLGGAARSAPSCP